MFMNMQAVFTANPGSCSVAVDKSAENVIQEIKIGEPEAITIKVACGDGLANALDAVGESADETMLICP